MNSNFLERKRDDAPETKISSMTLDIKALSEGGEFEGYASTFGNEDRGGDVVMPGAFRRTLREKKLHQIKFLRDHNSQRIVGEWLELQEDERGLKARGRLFIADDDNVPLARETYTLMKRRAIDALSIGYRTIKSTYDNENDVRQLLDLDLWEVSAVPFPMNEMATVDAVKGDLTQRDVERILREGGAPHEFAKMVAIHGYDGAKQRLGSRREGGHSGDLAELIRQTNANMKGMAQ